MLNYTQWMILGSGFAVAITTCRKGVIWPVQRGLFSHVSVPSWNVLAPWHPTVLRSKLQRKQDSSPVPSCNRGMCCEQRMRARLLISLWVVGQPHAMPATVSLLHFLSTANRGWSICFQSQCKPTDKNRNRQFDQHMTSNSWDYGTYTLLPNSSHPVYRGIYTLMHHHTSTACVFFKALVGHDPHRESPQIHVQ